MNRLCCTVVISALVLGGCQPSGELKMKAIIGAVLIDGRGGTPISDAVVVTSGSQIRAAGVRAEVPIPAGAEKVNGAGKFVVPGLIDLEGGPAVNAFVIHGVTYVRGALGPKFPRISSLAEVRRLVDTGSRAFVGVPADAEQIEADLLRHLRDLRIVFAPELIRAENSGEALARAQQNTKRLALAGIPIAVASRAEPELDTYREIELLWEAGLSPMEVIVAATRNGALALQKTGELGTIEPGKRADLLLLAANPLADVRNLRKLERVMVNGSWVGLPEQ